MKTRRLTILLSVLLVCSILFSCFLAVKVLKPEDGSIHYTLYIGLNDKDTYAQIIPTDKAKQIIDGICAKYVSGFAVQDAVGNWTDENGILTHENTILCQLDNMEEEAVYRLCDELRHALNQGTILIQKQYVQLDYYAGAEGE